MMVDTNHIEYGKKSYRYILDSQRSYYIFIWFNIKKGGIVVPEWSFAPFVEWFQKDIYIEGIKTGYVITREGNVYRKDTDGNSVVVKQRIDPLGHIAVDLHYHGREVKCFVHELMLEAFPDMGVLRTYKDNVELPPPDQEINDEYVNKDGKPSDKRRVYTNEILHKVCAALEKGEKPDSKIARELGVNYSLLRDIRYRGKHKDISSQYNISTTPNGLKSVREHIMDLMRQGLTNREIVRRLELPPNQKRHIEYCRMLYKKETRKEFKEAKKSNNKNE